MCEKKIKKSIFAFLLIPLFIAFGITIGPAHTQTFAALPTEGSGGTTTPAADDTGDAGDTGDTTDGDTGAPTSCAIDGIGWAICPIANFFGSIVDGMYGLIEDNLLSIDTGLIANGVNSPTYQAWAGLLGVGNVIFVIIFLLIIFSQATGYGITNYGIKKLLPKLIIGVILINVSYFICQAAVDISNIFGYGWRGFFTTLGDKQQTISWATVTSQILAAGLAGGAIAVASIGVGLSGLLVCVLTVVFIVLVLIIRKVLVIVCVVTAPIAFAAWLLPNTEKIFKLWWKVFYLMLIVFPVVSLVVGASALSSEIITKSLKDSANNTTFTGGGGGNF